MTDPKTLSQQRFNQFAQRYVNSEAHTRTDELGRLVEMAQPQAHWTMLDVATGGGHTALAFAPHVASVIASDIAQQMLEAARVHITEQGVTNVEFRYADAEDLPFDDDAFDLVTCRIAPHHFPNAARFVQEVARVLKVGGRMVIQDHLRSDDPTVADYAESFERLRDPSHNLAFTEGEWRAMFEAAGLVVEQVRLTIKRIPFGPWAERQSCSPEVTAELLERLRTAPEWMMVQELDTPDVSFVNHNIYISGRKA
ncbi:MAG: methyltransferase domain-containing protein [Anaerolineales bacterium]|nr:methyltransferase domain-containing protein [Anaerolineales bacterium]